MRIEIAEIVTRLAACQTNPMQVLCVHRIISGTSSIMQRNIVCAEFEVRVALPGGQLSPLEVLDWEWGQSGMEVGVREEVKGDKVEVVKGGAELGGMPD